MIRADTAPDIATKVDDMGFSVITDAPGEFGAVIKRDIELVGRIARAAGVRPE
jgi:hypothetical protein